MHWEYTSVLVKTTQTENLWKNTYVVMAYIVQKHQMLKIIEDVSFVERLVKMRILVKITSVLVLKIQIGSMSMV